MFLNLLRLWAGPLPKQELFPADRPVNPLLHWFIHPVKRRFAKYYLAFLQRCFGLKVIAITGSSGKTTTTNLLYSVLSRNAPTVRTRESVTSTYNLPTTILRCSPKTKYLILEMGVEYPGDMDFYTWLARPDIGLVLNISAVHASFLGSLADIRAEKYKLLAKSEIEVKPEDCPKITDAKITPDLTTQIRLPVSNSQFLVRLPLLGTHLAQNVSAVVKICSLLHLPPETVKSGLETATPAPHRMNVIRQPNGNLILDDTYNANPLSVTESLNTLSSVSATLSLSPVFVFGQMNELGRYELSAHQKIGHHLKQLKSAYPKMALFCLGPATRHTIKSAGFGRYFDDSTSLSRFLTRFCHQNSKICLLIKGSRSWYLDGLVTALLP